MQTLQSDGLSNGTLSVTGLEVAWSGLHNSQVLARFSKVLVDDLDESTG